MKKIILCIVLILSLCLLGGCQSKGEKLKTDKVTVNTISVFKNGSVQVGAVEDFDKNSFDEEDLKLFIDESIQNYNSEKQSGEVKLGSLSVQNNQAVLILEFDSIDTYIDFTYADFENIEGVNIPVSEALNKDLKSEEFIDAATGEKVSKEEALDGEKNKALILNEEIEVIVEGKIKYYSNAALLNKKTAQTGKKGISVIVYTP